MLVTHKYYIAFIWYPWLWHLSTNTCFAKLICAKCIVSATGRLRCSICISDDQKHCRRFVAQPNSTPGLLHIANMFVCVLLLIWLICHLLGCSLHFTMPHILLCRWAQDIQTSCISTAGYSILGCRCSIDQHASQSCSCAIKAKAITATAQTCKESQNLPSCQHLLQQCSGNSHTGIAFE